MLSDYQPNSTPCNQLCFPPCYQCFLCDSNLDTIAQHPRIVEWKSLLTWKINNFSKCGLKCNESLVSTEFKISGVNKTFYLTLYPQGFSKETEEHIAVYLRSCSNDKIQISLSVSIVNTDEREEDYIEAFHEENFKTCIGWREFISRQELQNKRSYFLPSDELTLTSVLTFSFKTPSFQFVLWQPEVFGRHSRSVLRKGSLTWKISNFGKNNLKTGEAFISPVFGISGMNTQFHLTLYPQGHTYETKEYIAVYLEADSVDKMCLSWTFYVVNKDDRNKDFRRNITRNGCFHPGWGSRKFISRKKFENEFGHLFRNNELTLTCVVNATDHVVDEEFASTSWNSD